MPASSEAMRRFMCTAWSVKKGDRPKSEVSARVVKTAETMSLEELEDFCTSPVKK